MTDKTATQNLTRTQITDNPRKMALYLQTLATETDLRMTAQRANLARSKGFPAAMLEISTPVVQAPGGPGTMRYDRVAFDTAGLADLSVDSRLINLGATGYWCIGAYVLCSGFSGGAPGAVGLWLGHGGSSTIVNYHDGGAGAVGCSYSVIEQTGTANSEIASCGLTNIGTFGPSPVTTIFRALLWAYKIRDL